MARSITATAIMALGVMVRCGTADPCEGHTSWIVVHPVRNFPVVEGTVDEVWWGAVHPIGPRKALARQSGDRSSELSNVADSFGSVLTRARLEITPTANDANN